jgi:uncharacterized protein
MRNLKFLAGLTVVLALSLVLALLYVMRTEQPPREAKKHLAGERKKTHRDTVPHRAPRPKEEGPERTRPVGTIAIVIDDLGYDLGPVEDLLALDVPITFAVLPHLRYSAETARTVHQAGREVLLHLPMEPHAYPERKPGEGALLLAMSENELRKTLSADIASVPYASGVNNHMGSRFMEDEGKLSSVLRQIKAKGLYFVDSRTTPSSQGDEIAGRLHLRFAARQVFIDNGRTYQQTLQHLEEAGNHCRSMLLIGHPYPSTIHALREAVPLMVAKGVRIVSASELAAPADGKQP